MSLPSSLCASPLLPSSPRFDTTRFDRMTPPPCSEEDVSSPSRFTSFYVYGEKVVDIPLLLPSPKRHCNSYDVLLDMVDSERNVYEEGVRRQLAKAYDLVYGLEWQKMQEEGRLSHLLNENKSLREEEDELVSHMNMIRKRGYATIYPRIWEDAETRRQCSAHAIEENYFDICKANTNLRKLEVDLKLARASLLAFEDCVSSS